MVDKAKEPPQGEKPETKCKIFKDPQQNVLFDKIQAELKITKPSALIMLERAVRAWGRARLVESYLDNEGILVEKVSQSGKKTTVTHPLLQQQKYEDQTFMKYMDALLATPKSQKAAGQKRKEGSGVDIASLMSIE